MQAAKQEDGPDRNKIGVRLKTKRKFERIAKARRMSLVETADELADFYLRNAGVISAARVHDEGDREGSASAA